MLDTLAQIAVHIVIEKILSILSEGNEAEGIVGNKLLQFKAVYGYLS